MEVLQPEAIEERIERHRKGDFTLRLADSDGNPARGAVEARHERHRFLFGCNCFPLLGHDDPDRERLYQLRFQELFHFATLGFYWGTYEPQPRSTREAHLRAQAAWLAERGIRAKGHPLVWHEVVPRWLPDDPERVRELALRRVHDVVSAFRGCVDWWDVFNELQAAGNFDNPVARWVAREGVPAVEHALRAAREANPDAVLLYNDYQIGDGLAEIVERLLRNGAPLDALGLQSHMHPGETPLEEIWQRVERFARFGLPLHFTELTVISGQHGWALNPWPDEEGGEERQAAYVERLYRLLFSHPAVHAVTWWDLQDGAWMGAPGGLLRRDLSPKPAYEALRRLIREHWTTRAVGRTEEDGAFRFRGFHGLYRVAVDTTRGRFETTVDLGPGREEATIQIG
ncbi:MAG: endo-1,4-beta-xylanase [Fimbriimonadales bacterium]|nr:endo-1,4-beta-xylanase [Fimbriimonadales bacterium]